jgi:aerobic carbon-monoxide dehydrogenase large subunit
MDVAMVMTNKTPTGSYGGPGRYEADFARERLFEIAARDLAIDRVEFCRKSLIKSSEMPYALPQVQPYGSRGKGDSCDYAAALNRCPAEIGWEKFKKRCGVLHGQVRGAIVQIFEWYAARGALLRS